MTQQLYMIGLIAQNMDKSLDFYRRLGLAFPEGSAEQPHVEVKLNGDLTLFLNAPGRVKALDNARGIILEFYLKERAAVDAKYSELTDAGYPSHHAPFVTPIGMYFAAVNDPDGNTIVLSAD